MREEVGYRDAPATRKAQYLICILHRQNVKMLSYVKEVSPRRQDKPDPDLTSEDIRIMIFQDRIRIQTALSKFSLYFMMTFSNPSLPLTKLLLA